MSRPRKAPKLTQAESLELAQRLDALDHNETPDGEVTARAADGVVVSVGNRLYAPAALLSFLRAVPPEKW